VEKNCGMTRDARFFRIQYTKKGEKYNKRPQNVPNYHTMKQMTTKYVYQIVSTKYQNVPIPRLSKYSKIVVLGMKIYHLAALGMTSKPANA
jgi:hypothetical protein